MKNKAHLSFYTLLLMGLFLVFVSSCKKDNNIEKSNTVINSDGITGTVTDVEGNIYKIVKIGDQWWMAENLRTTKYNDSSAIPLVTDNTTWVNLKTPAYCWYNNEAQYFNTTCGALYNWYAVNTDKLCPEGWHVASDSDWKELEMTLGMSQVEADNLLWRGSDQGSQLKSTQGWYNDGNGTDSIGFTAIPAGIRDWNGGTFYWIDTYSHWWTSSEESSSLAWDRDVHFDHSQVFRYPNNKNYGMSVRCVKD